MSTLPSPVVVALAAALVVRSRVDRPVGARIGARRQVGSTV